MTQSESTQSESAASMLRRLLTEPGACPTAREVALLADAYPYLAVPAAMRLKRAPVASVTADERAWLTARVATTAPDRATLFRLTDPDGALLGNFMPAETPAPPTATSTDSAIDTFLERYGRMSEHEEALLEKMIFNPVPDDYAALLAREDQGDAPSNSPAAEAAASPRSDAQDKLLDAFLATDHAFTVDEPEEAATDRSRPEPQPSKTADQPRIATPSVPVASPAPSSSLSESLARIYIKKGRYDKAYDIIHALSLNNPKKSVYFADQLRFLQKLMLNQRYATARREGQSKP